MSDHNPAHRAARAAALRLASDYGPELAEDVEAILHSGDGDRRPDQYLDPISLASLVVSVASLAWTIYRDLRRKSPKPAPEVIARQIRLELPASPERDHVVSVVVDEIAKGSAEDAKG